MKSNEHTPLRVEFTIETPMLVPRCPIMLDGLLAFGAVQRSHKQGRRDFSAQEELPLARFGAGADWVWQASALHIEYSSDSFAVNRTRPFQFHDWVGESGRVWEVGSRDILNAATGPMKGYLLRDEVAWVKRCVAWCIGDADDVSALLSELVGVGGLVRLGWGRLKGVAVVPDPAAAELWRRRVFPVAIPKPGDDWALGTAAIRAPYWMRGHQGPAWELIDTSIPMPA
jgi:CRISPR type IV-associated protein Csf3